jgi:hypothetical protein
LPKITDICERKSDKNIPSLQLHHQWRRLRGQREAIAQIPRSIPRHFSIYSIM